MNPADRLWALVAESRNGILATVGSDRTPQLSNIYYLFEEEGRLVRFSTTSDRTKGRNLLRDPRAAVHVPGPDFFNFAVVSGPVTVLVPQRVDDPAVDELYEIHSGLGATSEREGFGEEMLRNRRLAVSISVERIYGQILGRLPETT